MQIRTKILLSHTVKLTTVTLVCLGIVAGLAFTTDDRRRLKTSHEQLRNINLVNAEVNRFSEQIAELFIFGGQEADIVEAREALFERLQKQRELIEHEHILGGQPGATWGGLDRVAAMEDLVVQIDRARAELQAHLEAGRRPEAEIIYYRDIENRLDRALGQLVGQSMAREREEVADAIASSERLSRQSIALAIGLVFVVTALGIGNVVMLYRAILRPIRELVEGADAVGRGNLDHVVGKGASDELGNLADRFNQMTQQLKEQHDSILLAKSNLAKQVEDRTLELRERSTELEATNNKLRALDASRANFFADISHELRTPITVLRGQAEVTLRDTAADMAALRRSLEACVRKAEQIGRLVDDLLFLARSESGTVVVARNEVVLQEIIADVLLDGQALIRRDGVRIRPLQSSAPLTVVGDRDRIRQAVLIAVDNALKFAPADSVVDISLTNEADRAVIRVQDEGPGFDEEGIGNAFARFYRGKPGRHRSGRSSGLGLGLAIAKWIVRQHDGTILIARRADVGATVEMAFPLATAPAPWPIESL